MRRLIFCGDELTLVCAFQAEEKKALVATDLLSRMAYQVAEINQLGEGTLCFRDRIFPYVQEKLNSTIHGNRVGFCGAMDNSDVNKLRNLTTAQILSAPVAELIGMQEKWKERPLIIYVDTKSSQVYRGRADEIITSLPVSRIYVAHPDYSQGAHDSLISIKDEHMRRYGSDKLELLSESLEEFFMADQAKDKNHAGFASYVFEGGRMTELKRSLRGLEGVEICTPAFEVGLSSE